MLLLQGGRFKNWCQTGTYSVKYEKRCDTDQAAVFDKLGVKQAGSA